MAFEGMKSIHRPDPNSGKVWLSYDCGHCGRNVSGIIVSTHPQAYDYDRNVWLICPNCEKGSVRVGHINYPGSSFGPPIEGLPNEVKEAYEEARRCLSVNANTSCELICRKILMHVAVDKGANEGARFIDYVNYLETEGHITPLMKNWVDLIRQNGNQSTHRLQPPNRARAESTLIFTAELLRLTYEMEYLANKHTQSISPP
jgi:hypothetical protein